MQVAGLSYLEGPAHHQMAVVLSSKNSASLRKGSTGGKTDKKKEVSIKETSFCS